MNNIKFGNYSVDQIRQLSQLIQKANKFEKELKKVIEKADPQVNKDILGENFSWFHHYEMPFIDHMTKCISILDWMNEIDQGSEAEDPVHYFIQLIINADPEKEWKGGNKGINEKKEVVSLVLSMFKTIKSFMVYQKPLSKLIGMG